MPLINLYVPFDSNSDSVPDGEESPVDYWFIVKHELLLWKRWEDITAFSFGLLYLSVEMAEASFSRNFSSELLKEQVEELGKELTEILESNDLTNTYKVCHLAEDYEQSGSIVCCQNNDWQYVSTCDVETVQSPTYVLINSAVSLSIYLSLCVVVLVIFASSKPFLMTAPVLYSDGSIPIQIEFISKKLSFLVFFPYRVSLSFLIVLLELFVLCVWVKPGDAPGVYGYYQNFQSSIASETSVTLITIIFAFIGFTGFFGWLGLTAWGVRHRIRSGRVDQDFVLKLIDGEVSDEDASVPLRPESSSIIHPLLYDMSRKFCNLISTKAT
ncbi:MAG: hypothetical protein NXI00_24655, partial [Cytophagales bacterium]|nr:hypothetical protein [Cytophagales bacterium]